MDVYYARASPATEHDSDEADSWSLGERAGRAVVELLGLDAIIHTMEDVTEGLREAFDTMVQPLLQPLVQPFHVSVVQP